jgi:ABC-type polysaccharide/polyol phosphate export permease
MLSLAQLIRNIVRYRAMIGALALRDLQSRYAGTLGGTLWAFAHPLAIVVIFYFVFAVGFKAQGPSSTPFILWFVCGLVPWFFFNDTLLTIADSITRNAHLVKKTVFPTEILPLVHITSGLFPHAIFLVILAGMLAFFKMPFLPDRLLVVYFLICTCALLIGFGWMLSALQVFYRDISQALTIFLNLWFWVTPIVWSPEIMPAAYRGLLFYNPMYYVIEGYRGLLIFNSSVWPGAMETAYFWSVTLLAFFVGAYIFRRLKPEFADVM